MGVFKLDQSTPTFLYFSKSCNTYIIISILFYHNYEVFLYVYDIIIYDSTFTGLYNIKIHVVVVPHIGCIVFRTLIIRTHLIMNTAGTERRTVCLEVAV